jgi:NAD(P)H-nitrite reductase large subunit
MNAAKSYVIIGNSAAAIGCVEGIRQIDAKSPITIIASEPHHTYSRPLISYLLQGRTTEGLMRYRDEDFYAKHNCCIQTGATVAKIDAKAKQVELTGGEKIPYDKLLVATGSRPFVPPMDGLDKIDYYTFMTLDSARELEKVITKQSRVLIIGGGLIGMKCAEGIAERAGHVTVVEMMPRVLPTVLDEEGAAIIQKQMELHDIRFILGDSVKTFTPNTTGGDEKPRGGTALLNGTPNGTDTVGFDILIAAVGVRPNTQLVSDAGGLVEKGIVVDARCATTLPDVFAAGDCTESEDISFGKRRILALLPNAYMQGETAGINMAGGEKVFDTAFPVNAAGFFDLHLVTAGSYTGEALLTEFAGQTSFVPTKDSPYRKFFIENDLLKGFIIIGDTSRAGIYTALIRDKTPLSSIDFERIKTAPQLMAFSKAKRAEILSGGVNA